MKLVHCQACTDNTPLSYQWLKYKFRYGGVVLNTDLEIKLKGHPSVCHVTYSPNPV